VKLLEVYEKKLKEVDSQFSWDLTKKIGLAIAGIGIIAGGAYLLNKRSH